MGSPGELAACWDRPQAVSPLERSSLAFPPQTWSGQAVTRADSVLSHLAAASPVRLCCWGGWLHPSSRSFLGASGPSSQEGQQPSWRGWTLSSSEVGTGPGPAYPLTLGLTKMAQSSPTGQQRDSKCTTLQNIPELSTRFLPGLYLFSAINLNFFRLDTRSQE